jgi:glycosyltransferase involved in cell wall biosynthesis
VCSRRLPPTLLCGRGSYETLNTKEDDRERTPLRGRRCSGEIRLRQSHNKAELFVVSLPLVTVVTVVYNGEEHLAECAESVLRQTYDNWEYFIVDNCSTDGTPEIAREFANRDSRIRYERHDEFVDVIQSHNRGFRTVGPASTYCKFVGADDWLFPECLSMMVELAESNPAVGIVGSYRLNGAQVDLVALPYWQSTDAGREIVARDIRFSPSSGSGVTGSPTALLLRSAFIREREPFYDETFRHADTEAAYRILMQSDFGLVHQVLTFIRGTASAEAVRSGRLGSFWPDRLRTLIRYGPLVLSPSEYREELRQQLRAYIVMLAKQRVKPSRWGDDEFHSFSRHAINRIVAESDDDPDVRRALNFARLLLR